MRRLERRDMIVDEGEALSKRAQPLLCWKVSELCELAVLHAT